MLRDGPEYMGKGNAAAAGRYVDVGNQIHEAMRPTPEDVDVERSMDPKIFMGLHQGDGGGGAMRDFDWHSVEGAEVTDKGFTSTSLNSDWIGVGGSAMVDIHVPAGTNALYTQPYAANPDLNEQELLLDKGTTYRVTGVDTSGHDEPGASFRNVHIKMEVVHQ